MEDSSSPFLESLKASRPAKISAAERAADVKEIARLSADLDLTKRVVISQRDRIRDLMGDVRVLQSAVASLQRQGRPAVRNAAPTRKRDGLDDELERDLHD
jgi:hypothetical protein